MRVSIVQAGAIFLLLFSSIYVLGQLFVETDRPLQSAALATGDCAHAERNMLGTKSSEFSAGGIPSGIRSGAMGGRGQPQPVMLAQVSAICATP